MPQSLVAQCFANVSFLSTHDKKSCFLSKTGLFLYFLTNLICGSGWQRRPEDVFHCPPKIVWPTRSYCLIFVSNLASTITQQQKRALFVEAVTLVTWTKQQEENSCIPQNTLSAFSAWPTFCPPHAGNIPRTCRATRREHCAPPSGSISSFWYLFIVSGSAKYVLICVAAWYLPGQ